MIGAVWVTGGYRQPWHDEAVAVRFAGVKLLVVQDCFASPLWNRADYQLPGGTFAEREGSYVNATDRLQSFKWAIRPPAGVWVEGQLYWTMLNMRGLYNARTVLNEVATTIPAFSAAAGEIPAVGIDLRINQLAAAPA